MTNQTRWALATLVVNVGLLGCSADPGSDPIATGGSSGSGTGGTGGTSGGATSGGATMGGATQGGATQGGATQGGATSGGATMGGASQGGATQGGATSGGATSGGATSGGKSSGGATSGGATSGGKSGSGGATSGGMSSGGKTSGGATSGGATSGGATNSGAGPAMTCNCKTSAGEFSGNPVGSTIVVDGGENYDGKCMTYRASNALGDGTQKEGQKPIFIVNGGTLQNVVIGNSAADGIHLEGPATLKNIHWLDIGEDAMSMPSGVSGNPSITLDCGSSAQGDDKTFQVNSASTWTIKNFTAKTAGKFMRQNGDTTFKMTVNIDHCDIADMGECIYRTDSSSSIVNMTNTRYHNVGDLFIFGSSKVNGDTHNQVGTFSGNQSY